MRELAIEEWEKKISASKGRRQWSERVWGGLWYRLAKSPRSRSRYEYPGLAGKASSRITAFFLHSELCLHSSQAAAGPWEEVEGQFSLQAEAGPAHARSHPLVDWEFEHRVAISLPARIWTCGQCSFTHSSAGQGTTDKNCFFRSVGGWGDGSVGKRHAAWRPECDLGHVCWGRIL